MLTRFDHYGQKGGQAESLRCGADASVSNNMKKLFLRGAFDYGESM
jgi:hypothetical protein